MTNEELQAIADVEMEKIRRYRHVIHVCSGTGCQSSGSQEVYICLQNLVAEMGLRDSVLVKQAGCSSLCSAGPVISIHPDGPCYGHVTPEDCREILVHLDREPLQEKILHTDSPFFYRQQINLLENFGKIDAEHIEDYIAYGGYAALVKALAELSPADVIHEVEKSGLRGRGGGGYQTGLKWSTVSKAAGDNKYVICNADEGDPGAFMGRSLLECNPHLILEGMAIAAYAVGAREGIIYVRAEYPLAIKRLQNAIQHAEMQGYLGKKICHTRFDFHVEIRMGAGAFVCGEETALIHSIEGKRGIPRHRPPYPAQSGLWKSPTLVNNVETLANIAGIILDGGEWFARIGTHKSKGTKLITLTGCIKNTGLIEVPMGITLKEIVFDIGGGMPQGQQLKAVHIGGPSGIFVPVTLLDTRFDFESFEKIDSSMGSGGMVVIDDATSIIEMAKYFVDFNVKESCGKCIPCRVGTAQMSTLLDRFLVRRGSQQDIQNLEDLCDLLKNTSLCGLGQSAPNPVISSLKYFRNEYLENMLALEDGHIPVQMGKDM